MNRWLLGVGAVCCAGAFGACGGQASESTPQRANSNAANDESANDARDAGSTSAAGSGVGAGAATQSGSDTAGSNSGGSSTGGSNAVFGDPALGDAAVGSSSAQCGPARDGGQEIVLQFGDEVHSLQLQSAKMMFCGGMSLELEACAGDVCLSFWGPRGTLRATVTRNVIDGFVDNKDSGIPDLVTVRTVVDFPAPDWPAQCYLEGQNPVYGSQWLDLETESEAQVEGDDHLPVKVRLSIPVDYEDPGCLI